MPVPSPVFAHTPNRTPGVAGNPTVDELEKTELSVEAEVAKAVGDGNRISRGEAIIILRPSKEEDNGKGGPGEKFTAG